MTRPLLGYWSYATGGNHTGVMKAAKVHATSNTARTCAGLTAGNKADGAHACTCFQQWEFSAFHALDLCVVVRAKTAPGTPLQHDPGPAAGLAQQACLACREFQTLCGCFHCSNAGSAGDSCAAAAVGGVAATRTDGGRQGSAKAGSQEAQGLLPAEPGVSFVQPTLPAASACVACGVTVIQTCVRRTMTMKECRAVLEQDMHLAASALKQHKDYVNELIDKVRAHLWTQSKEV